MCDYSLENVKSVKAVVGEKYVVTRFPSNSVGFAPEAQTDCAACVEVGTLLRLSSKDGEVVVRMTKANETIAYAHHDAVEMPDGSVRLLGTLPIGSTMELSAIDLDKAFDLASADVSEPELIEA